MMTASKFIQMKHCSDVSHKAQRNDLRIVYIYTYISKITHKLIHKTTNKTVPITSTNQLLSNDIISSKRQSWGPVHNGRPCSSPQRCTDVHVLSSSPQSAASVTRVTVWLNLLQHSPFNVKKLYILRTKFMRLI